jgi:WD40 repeat protein
MPDAADAAGSQLAEDLETPVQPAESASEPGLLTPATDHGADVPDLPTSGQPPPAVAGASEGLPAAAAVVAEDQRTGDPGTIVQSDEPGLATDALAPVQADDETGTTSPTAPVVADDESGTTSPTAPVMAGDDLPVAVVTTPAAPVAAGDEVPAAVATTPAAPVVAGDGVPAAAATTPATPVRAGEDVPAAVAATTPAGRQVAGDPGTAGGSGEPPSELPWLTVPGSGGEGTWPAQRAPRRRGPVAAWIRRYRLPVFALACAAVAAAATLPFISAGHPTSSRPGASTSPPISARPAAAIGFGWVSLGNLSQTPSLADVYLYSSGSSSPQFVQHGVAYGTILPYKAVNAGNYTVKVRAAGATASSNPVWSVSFTVHPGGAYTVAPILARAQQGQLKVIDNDLTPPAGKSFVRVIQADINQGRVTFHCSCAAGAPGNITTDAAPGSVSQQTPIPTGTWTMTATGASASAHVSLPVTLTDGTVHNEIVISKPGGGIEIINLVQAPPSYKRVALPLNDSGTPITSVAFSPSGADLAIVAPSICLWDVTAGGCTSTFGNPSGSTYSVAFSPDGKTLAVTDDSGKIYLWDVASRQTVPLTDPEPGGYWVAFSPDGKTLAVSDGNGHTYLWNVATRKRIFTITDPGRKGVDSVAFTHDGKILAIGDQYGATYLWDVATRKQIFKLSDPGGNGVNSVAFSPDGKILVAGDGNGHAYLWNVATGKQIFTLPDPGTMGVSFVACSPDNTTMAAAGNNGSIYIWNVDNGKLLATLTDPGKPIINAVAFSPDGQVLAASDNNGGVLLWYKS